MMPGFFDEINCTTALVFDVQSQSPAAPKEKSGITASARNLPMSKSDWTTTQSNIQARHALAARLKRCLVDNCRLHQETDLNKVLQVMTAKLSVKLLAIGSEIIPEICCIEQK